jgi:outer membrane protein assembly factor BamE (lipoprotein component of BamABCDE complex)
MTQAPLPPAPMVTAQNAAQIQLGMTSEQVRQLMGNPTMAKPEGQFVEWKYYTPQGKFEVKFQNDRVISFSSH